MAPSTVGFAVLVVALVPTLFSTLTGCSGSRELGSQPVPRPSRPAAADAEESSAAASLLGYAPASSSSAAAESAKAEQACPADMAFVDTSYCPNVRLNCKDSEYNTSNRITICNEFAPGRVCKTKERRQRFCIDKYEYPNREGAHPPVMVDWYDAAGLCAAKGKRLCWESEWVSACEGPEKLPFPYGHKRDATKCNIDNRWLNVKLDDVYARDPKVQDAELLRLDQSVPSGGRPGCVSGFGVYDLTGNVDEWVNAEATHKKSRWAGLKGGAWGHVRNACRPITVSHPPEFSYYFISFRCCADAAPDAEASRDPNVWVPPPVPDRPHPSGKISPGWTPRERGPNQPL